MTSKIIKIQKISLVIILITFIVVSSFPSKTHAVLGVGDLNFDSANFVENSMSAISNVASDLSTFFIKYKESVLDGIAWMMAKQAIQMITGDIVDWINSGFDGNPAFLTNPGGFFLDAADQVTGELIANAGPLSALCSPINVDIRLSIAMQQVKSSRKRYACTLGKIIEAQKNGPNITLNGRSVLANGKTQEGFLGGDFYQGGWPAFIAYTTEPQNNFSGALLMAQADAQAQINSRQANIRADLSLGSGFMSSKKCKDLTTARTEEEAIQAEEIIGNDPSITTKYNKDGSITYQSCKTETPGSVIASSLNKQLGAPTDSLVTADEINEIIGALFNALVTTVLKGGLNSSSQINTGYTQSPIREMVGDTSGTRQYQGQDIVDNINKYYVYAVDYKSTYDQAITDINDLENFLLNLRNICQNNNHTLETDAVQQIIYSNFASLKTMYTGKSTTANLRYQKINELQIASRTASTPAQINELANKYAELLTSGVITIMDVQDAKDDLGSLKGSISSIKNSVSQYQYICNQHQ